jgi:hypothetical protein
MANLKIAQNNKNVLNPFSLHLDIYIFAQSESSRGSVDSISIHASLSGVYVCKKLGSSYNKIFAISG